VASENPGSRNDPRYQQGRVAEDSLSLDETFKKAGAFAPAFCCDGLSGIANEVEFAFAHVPPSREFPFCWRFSNTLEKIPYRRAMELHCHE
jgi:hypothetical protein